MARSRRRRGGGARPSLGAVVTTAIAFALLVVIVVLGLSTADRFVRGRSRAEAPPPEPAPAGGVERKEVLIDVLNGGGEKGAAEAVARALRRGGFDVVEIGNVAGFGFDETIVVDREGKPGVRRDVASYLGCENVVLERRKGSATAVTVIVGKDYRMLRLDGGRRGE